MASSNFKSRVRRIGTVLRKPFAVSAKAIIHSTKLVTDHQLSRRDIQLARKGATKSWTLPRLFREPRTLRREMWTLRDGNIQITETDFIGRSVVAQREMTFDTHGRLLELETSSPRKRRTRKTYSPPGRFMGKKQ